MRRFTAAAVLTLCLVVGVLPAAGQPTVPDQNPATTDRITLTDPVAGAITLSAIRFPNGGADRVVLATTAGFADSLAAAPLLGAGPLLLTPPDQLPANVATEIDRVLGNDPTREVVVLGGTASISNTVTDQLEDRYSVIRLAGPDRVATAIEVVSFLADRVGAGQVVAIARAFGEGSAGWADSITASAWSANTGTPLLITPTDTLDSRVAALLSQLGTDTAIVLGGTAAISDTVANQLPDARRVAGPDRTTTATAIAENLYGPTGGYLLINGYADTGWTAGLPAAGLAADLDHPLLLADTTTLPDATRARLGLGCGSGPAQIETTLIGDTAALADSLRTEIDTHDGGECPTPPVHLLGDGLDVVDLGTPGPEAIAALTNVFGPPEVSEELFPFCEPSASGRGRIYTYGGVLDIYINDPTASPAFPGQPANPGTGNPYFWGALYGGYAYDPATDTVNRRVDTLGLQTVRSIGLGSTNAEVRAAYPDGTFDPGTKDGFPPPNWSYPEGLGSFATSSADSGEQATFFIGNGCGE